MDVCRQIAADRAVLVRTYGKARRRHRVARHVDCGIRNVAGETAPSAVARADVDCLDADDAVARRRVCRRIVVSHLLKSRVKGRVREIRSAAQHELMRRRIVSLSDSGRQRSGNRKRFCSAVNGVGQRNYYLADIAAADRRTAGDRDGSRIRKGRGITGARKRCIKVQLQRHGMPPGLRRCLQNGRRSPREAPRTNPVSRGYPSDSGLKISLNLPED